MARMTATKNTSMTNISLLRMAQMREFAILDDVRDKLQAEFQPTVLNIDDPMGDANKI